jgi:SAM-dependent methyltransferase
VIPSANPDPTHGYEAIAARFMAYRAASTVGVATVRTWAQKLPRGAAVLDLGCGSGQPISQVLIDAGCALHGVDASPGLLAAFRARFPHAPAECNAAERSDFFGRTFDGVIAWGLLFLLRPEDQTLVLRRVAPALNDGGQFLFTAPAQACTWADAMTGQTSVALGADAYRQTLTAAGLTLIDTFTDEGANHYYLAAKAPAAKPASKG